MYRNSCSLKRNRIKLILCANTRRRGFLILQKAPYSIRDIPIMHSDDKPIIKIKNFVQEGTSFTSYIPLATSFLKCISSDIPA